MIIIITRDSERARANRFDKQSERKEKEAIIVVIRMMRYREREHSGGSEANAALRGRPLDLVILDASSALFSEDS